MDSISSSKLWILGLTIDILEIEKMLRDFLAQKQTVSQTYMFPL